MVIRTPRDLGLLIRDRRRGLQLGQQELASRVGVSRKWVVEVERGKPGAPVGLVFRTLTVLGLSTDVREAQHLSSRRPAAGPVDIDSVIEAARRRG